MMKNKNYLMIVFFMTGVLLISTFFWVMPSFAARCVCLDEKGQIIECVKKSDEKQKNDRAVAPKTTGKPAGRPFVHKKNKPFIEKK